MQLATPFFRMTYSMTCMDTIPATPLFNVLDFIWMLIRGGGTMAAMKWPRWNVCLGTPWCLPTMMAAMKCLYGNPWGLTAVAIGLWDTFGQWVSQVLQLHFSGQHRLVNGYHRFYSYILVGITGVTATLVSWWRPQWDVSLATHGVCHCVPSGRSVSTRMMFLPMCRLVQLMVSTWQLTVVSLRTLDCAATRGWCLWRCVWSDHSWCWSTVSTGLFTCSMVGATVVTGLHGYVLVGRWWLRCMVRWEISRRQQLMVSTLITGFAATSIE